MTIFLALTGCTHKQAKTYFENCSNESTGGLSIPFSGSIKKHEFRQDCAPDILYSWQANQKVDWSRFPHNPLTKGIYLYTWRTPIATYAFGDIQIRIKLKPNIKFKWFEKNRGEQRLTCPQADQEETIYVLTTTYSKTVSEYLICSPKVMHSWSVNTKAAFYEAKNELIFITSNFKDMPQRFDAFGFGFNRKRIPPLNKEFSSDSYFVNWDGDKIEWSDERLMKSLNSLKKRSIEERELIFYAPDVKANRQEHLSTKVPSYFQLSQDQQKEF